MTNKNMKTNIKKTSKNNTKKATAVNTAKKTIHTTNKSISANKNNNIYGTSKSTLNKSISTNKNNSIYGTSKSTLNKSISANKNNSIYGTSKSTLNKSISANKNNSIYGTSKSISNRSTSTNKNYINNYNGEKLTKKRIIVRRKLKIDAIIILVSIIMILAGIPILIFIFNSDNNDNINNNIADNNIEDNNHSKEDFPENEKLSFYKKENADRYKLYQERNPNLDFETIVVYVNIGLDKDFYTNILESPLQHTNVVLTNKYYSLSKNYIPKNLKVIDSKYSSGNKKMVKDAADAFNELARDAKLEGYTIRAVSTYRSYDYQKNLYSNYVKSDGVKNADTYSARAGHSEHQTGLAVDVDNGIKSYTNFGSTKEFEWMKKNAYKYGFILRYTKDIEFITGYKDEPWHYRYVGVEIATYIQNNPMSYEEYYIRFLEK